MPAPSGLGITISSPRVNDHVDIDPAGIIPIICIICLLFIVIYVVLKLYGTLCRRP